MNLTVVGSLAKTWNLEPKTFPVTTTLQFLLIAETSVGYSEYVMKARKILIIEDEPEIRLILAKCFQHTGGFDPILAGDGVEGIELAREQMPDVILIDAVMPKLDGYATCRLIKQDSGLKDIPVIFLTAKTDRREVSRAIRAGACGYLPKPFDPLQLASQIDKIAAGAVRP